jgi:hypothetical protein
VGWQIRGSVELGTADKGGVVAAELERRGAKYLVISSKIDMVSPLELTVIQISPT